jgi:hypothetical protein
LGLDGKTTVGGSSVWPLPPGHSGNGIPGGDFVVNFAVDVAGAIPYPTPLQPVNPLGGLIHQGTPAYSNLLSASDTDSFTLAVTAGALGYITLKRGAAVVPGDLANTPGDTMSARCGTWHAVRWPR